MTTADSPQTAKLQAAFDTFVATWWPYTVHDVLGGRTSCIEADALADVFEAAGYGDLLPTLATIHAVYDDDCDDRHHDEYLRLTGKTCTCCAAGHHRPDDDPEPGNRCKDCGKDLTWRGPGPNDWDVVEPA